MMTPQELAGVTVAGIVGGLVLLGFVVRSVRSARKLEPRLPTDFSGYKIDPRGRLIGGVSATGIAGLLLLFGAAIPYVQGNDLFTVSTWLAGCLLILGNVFVVPSATRHCRFCHEKLEIYRDASAKLPLNRALLFVCPNCRRYYSLAWLTGGS